MLLDIFSSLDYQFSKILVFSKIIWVLRLVWFWLIMFKYFFLYKKKYYFFIILTKIFLLNFNSPNLKIFQNVFSLVYSFSFLIIFIKFWSLIPYVYGLTTSFVVGLTFGLSYWIMIQLRRIEKNINSYVRHFSPKGTNIGLAVILRYVDLVRLVVRPFTLTLRLVIKMSIGHVIFSLLGLVISNLFFKNILFRLIILRLLIFFFIVELFVCVIQSLVFGLLKVNYLGEHS